MKLESILLVPVAFAASVLAPVLCAEPVSDFRQAITQAVLTSPRVNASWYNFEATREAQTSARAAYLPSVDINADIGEEDRETPLVDIGSYSRDATRFSITQMLFDGFQTREEVSRLGHEKLSLFYELKRASEETALEAADAYLDTMRYQKLVKLAEKNYIVHRQIFDKISERSHGGVSQGVDLEQAASRVALAESNLLTEMTNLHDVRTRFQRVVGELPAEELVHPVIPSSMIPEHRQLALNRAYELSPEISAAIENLRAAQAAKNATNAPFMPRIDLRYRNERENDTDGINGRFDIEAIELVFTYNLFRGGADSARKREFYNRFNAAIEERKQACLNVRQNVMIAFNDIAALEQQLVYLNQSQLSQDKTRRAYRDQFDLGRRSLLDLLDSQNEYFDTQRAYYSAEADLLSAKSTTLSNMGLFLTALEVDGLNESKISELQLNLDRGNDANGQPLCPPEPPDEVTIDKEALLASLMEKNALKLVRSQASYGKYWPAATGATGHYADIHEAENVTGDTVGETSNSFTDLTVSGFGESSAGSNVGAPGNGSADSVTNRIVDGSADNAVDNNDDAFSYGADHIFSDERIDSFAGRMAVGSGDVGVESLYDGTIDNSTESFADNITAGTGETGINGLPDSAAGGFGDNGAGSLSDRTAGGSGDHSNGSNNDSISSAVNHSYADNHPAQSIDSSGGRSASDAGSVVEVPIKFRFNSYYISVHAELGPEIARLARKLNENPDARVVVEGHTDSSGNDQGWNLLLSTRRANAVRDKLIRDYDVNPDQVSAVGYGSKRPIAGNNTREGRKRNRRVVVVMDSPDTESAWPRTAVR